jgi:hypothetical protein
MMMQVNTGNEQAMQTLTQELAEAEMIADAAAFVFSQALADVDHAVRLYVHQHGTVDKFDLDAARYRAGYYSARTVWEAKLQAAAKLRAMTKERRMTDTPRPTRGQQRILQLCCRTAYVLLGERASGVPHYRIQERGTGRVVMAPVSVVMVTQLTQLGWIEPATGGNASEWTYRVTTAGIAAANGPTRCE